MSFRKTLAVDFDGVVHAYSRGWQGGDIYDVPMPHTAESLAQLAVQFRLVIFTARDDLAAVRAWLRKYDLLRFFDEVTNVKPKAFAYLDDRGVRFVDWPTAVEIIKQVALGDDWQPVLEPLPTPPDIAA